VRLPRHLRLPGASLSAICRFAEGVFTGFC